MKTQTVRQTMSHEKIIFSVESLVTEIPINNDDIVVVDWDMEIEIPFSNSFHHNFITKQQQFNLQNMSILSERISMISPKTSIERTSGELMQKRASKGKRGRDREGFG
ncbi:hypothetical protein T01_6844 [Trichinella spiralis]|uniref:Uncharacterized protein n=1 Tax=Trichinella spiralis TaxID=6334 RepID=A0A0V1BVS4_TRISP|nr:hypothetical protein T01_6844 [Trichinella spiralis]